MLFNYKEHRIFAFSDSHGMHKRLHIPEEADILLCAGDVVITHIPPEGILDEGRGSRPLLLEVYRSQPRFHVFGHAHSCGNQSKGGAFTEFYNVSQFNELKNQDGGQ